MKIVVLSDTHFPKGKKGLPTRLLDELKDVDMILHAGDWQTIDVYNELQSYARVEGVYGNVDDHQLLGLLPLKKIVEVGGFKIGITHGHGKGKTTEKRAISVFEGEKVDCIIFGHSHIPVKRFEGDILILTQVRQQTKEDKSSFLLECYPLGDKIAAEHIFFNEDVANGWKER